MTLIIYNSVSKEWIFAKQSCEENNNTLVTVFNETYNKALIDLMKHNENMEVFIGGKIVKQPFTWYNSLV